MTLFRPVLDLHRGQVKQIVGGTLSGDDAELRTHFVSEQPPRFFTEKYREDGLTGGHVIMLGPGNDVAALEALAAYPGGLQLGGGMRADNASRFLEAGASHVIVTSWLFNEEARFQPSRLEAMIDAVGAEHLVIDLSCRRVEDRWVVAMNRWQTLTDLEVNAATLDQLACSCSEFLIHAADVEGKCEGIDADLVSVLGACACIPITYAGGARSMTDLDAVAELSDGKVDLAIGSALDLFGGSLIKYADCVAYNRRHA